MTQRHAPPSRWAIGLLTAIGFALRVFHMNAQSLWFDEVVSVQIATTPVDTLVRAIEGAGAIEPTAWLSTAFYALAKGALLIPHARPDALLRATSVAIGTLTIPAFAWMASALLPAAAVVAGTAFVAISPFHVWYSQEFRPYALLLLLTVLAMGAFLRALATDRTGHWIAFVACTTLALYTHSIALGLPIVAGLAVVFVARDDLRRAVHGAVALAAAGAAFLPMMLFLARHGANHPADPRPMGWLDVPYALYAYAVGFSLGPSTTELHGGTLAPLLQHLPVIVIAAVAFATVIGRGALATAELPTRERLVLWAWLVVPVTLAATIAAVSANPFNVRYTIVSFPAFAAIVGIGAVRLSRVAGVLVGSVLVALIAFSLHNLYFDQRFAKEDCRSLGEYLASEAGQDDLVVVNAPYMATAVSYYYAGPARVLGYPRYENREVSDADAAGLLALVTGHPRVWLVSARTFHGDRSGTLERVLASRLAAEDARSFPGIRVRRFATR